MPCLMINGIYHWIQGDYAYQTECKPLTSQKMWNGFKICEYDTKQCTHVKILSSDYDNTNTVFSFGSNLTFAIFGI